MDKDCLDLINKAHKLNHKIEIISNVKSGKEAVVYKGQLDGILVAIKIYKDINERTFQKNGQYLEGKFYKTKSHRKAIAKGNTFAKKLKYQNWVRREYYLLEKLYELGAKIPKPLLHIDNVIVMEFIGDNEIVAPRLQNVVLSVDDSKKAFSKIIDTILIFWKFGIVHADLSEYNILWWNNEPYIIDFPQALDKKSNPNVEEILDRDLNNIIKYFSKTIEINIEDMKKLFI